MYRYRDPVEVEEAGIAPIKKVRRIKRCCSGREREDARNERYMHNLSGEAD